MCLNRLFYCLIGTLVVLAMLSGCSSEVASAFTESEVSFQSGDAEIAATLAVPEGKGPFPAVIVIGGSEGPFDRNGDLDAWVVETWIQNELPVMALNSSYKDIAQALSGEGFVTLRYDKRGVGNSTWESSDMPEPSLEDLKAAVAFLKENPSVDPERIALIGH